MTLTRTISPTDIQLFQPRESPDRQPDVSAPVSTEPAPYYRLYDGLHRLNFGADQVKTVLDLFQELAEAVITANAGYYWPEDNTFKVPMDMSAHDLLDVIMADKALPAEDSLHELANQVYLPAGMTFVHDVTDFCVLEVQTL